MAMKVLFEMLVLCLIGISSPLTGQIIYTDINNTVLVFPTPTQGHDNLSNLYYFDLDQDGDSDLHFVAYYYETWESPSAPDVPSWEMIVGMNDDSSSVARDTTYHCNFVELYNAGGRIDGDRPWSYYYHHLYRCFLAQWPCCLESEDQFLEFKINDNGVVYYAWMRFLSFCSNDYIYYLEIKDYAINLTPGMPIYAGQTAEYEEIIEYPASEIISMISNGYLDINSGLYPPELIRITDVQGRSVCEIDSPSAFSHINISGLSPGIYFAAILSKTKLVTKKFTVL